MVAKKNISVKLTDEQITTLKGIASDQGVTLTDVVIEGMGATVEKVNLTRQIQELREQIQEMRKDGKKINLGKRISVPVSREEFKKIHLESAKMGLPKGRFIRELLISGKSLPVLSVKP